MFSDIDGTLLNSRHRLTERTIRAVRELTGGGVPFILVSSRSPHGMFPIQDRLGIRSPLVCFGGGLILDEDREPVRSIGMTAGQAGEVREALRSGGIAVCFSAYSGLEWFVDDPRDPWIVQEGEITATAPAGSVVEILAEGREIHKLLCMGEPTEIAAADMLLTNAFPGLMVCRSKDTYLEIMDRGATKSGSVRFLCGRCGLPVSDTLAFGDNYNDIDMLEAAGIGVAMGNAPEAVKERADRVTMDNDHDGVAALLCELAIQG